MQDSDEMSRSMRCRDMPKSTIELIQSPNAARHCTRWSTSPVQNVMRSSCGWMLRTTRQAVRTLSTKVYDDDDGDDDADDDDDDDYDKC